MTRHTPRCKAAALTIVPAAKYARPHPDATLIAGCDRFVALDAKWRRLLDVEGDCAPHSVEMKAVGEVRKSTIQTRDACVGEIEDLPAHTLDGMRAKARAIFAFFHPDPPQESIMDGLLWSLICDLVGDDTAALTEGRD